MTIEDKIRKAIIDAVNTKSKKGIVIYPFGVYGKKVKDILNKEFDIYEAYIIDNNISEDSRIQQVESMDNMNDYIYLIACRDTKVFTDIMKTLNLKVDDENIIDIFAEWHYHLYQEPEFVLYDATRKGMDLGGWYEKRLNQVGRTDTVTDAIMNTISIPEGGTFCEIGPGTGRYMQKFIEKARPQKYEFYEVQKKLAEYLVKALNYNFCEVIAREADGYSLKDTHSCSQDVIFANSVWPIIKYSNIYQYFLEMIRVCKVGGYVIFDAYTEDSYTERILNDKNCLLNEWRLLPNRMIMDIFISRKMKLEHKFEFPYINFMGSWYIFKKLDNK